MVGCPHAGQLSPGLAPDERVTPSAFHVADDRQRAALRVSQ
ncbi:MAG: hypothetical protein Q8M58_09665 [Anaerolineales bacterium]|nr:hypothetical protein [Anaerolineales bacterium]